MIYADTVSAYVYIKCKSKLKLMSLKTHVFI